MSEVNPILGEDIERIHSQIGSANAFADAVVVITGCAGFLGYYLTQYLVRYASELRIRKVIGLDTFLLDRPRWLGELVAAYPNVLELHAFDVSRDSLAKIPGADKATHVIHGASIASPTFYRQYPVKTIDANIWGLRHILDFYREKKLMGLLFFSSSEIYGDPDSAHIPTSEDYRGLVSCTGPRACYDESKRFGETMSWIYAKEYGMPVTIARPFNNYGPGMRLGDRRLPADFAKCIVENRDIVILSDGRPTRTFCYVSDAVSGYLLCLLHGRYDYFNIGIDKPEVSVVEFAKLFQRAGSRVFNYKGEVLFRTSDDPDYMTDNPNRRCPIISKAREILGYEPRIFVDEGIERLLKYLKCEGAGS